MSGFRFVSEHRDSYPVARLCRVVGINRSGFYKWKSREPSVRDHADAELLEVIKEIHRRSRGTYGAPRVHGQLQRLGWSVGRKRVTRLMASSGLVGVHGRRRWRHHKPDTAPAPDLVNRDFTAQRPGELWVADITEFNTGEGKQYVAGVLDVATGRLVGWSTSHRQTSDLVVDAMVMAASRNDLGDGLVHHSDHGSQYTSMVFTNRLADLGITASFGSVGDCYDNARMESFWATMKREIAWTTGIDKFETRAQLRAVIFDYIEIFYNRQRHQQGLNNMTPNEYEQAITAA